MSVTPLPALQAALSAPTQPASAPPTHVQHASSFHAHLQSAQQSQPQTPDDDSRTDSHDSHPQPRDGDAQTNSAQARDASSKDSKPGDDTSQSGTDDSNGIDLTGGIGTLAGVVLGLIDHANGDAHTGNPTTTTKPATVNKPQPSATPPTAPMGIVPVPMAAVVPTPLPAVPGGAAQAGIASTGGIGSALSSKSALAFDAKSDDAAVGDTGAVAAPASTDAGSVMQGLADNAQTFASSAAPTSHAALPAATFATDNTSQANAGINALGNLTASAPVVPAGNSTHSLAMDAPVGSSGFAKELGQQITWLSGQDVKQAQIRLNPQDLGPLDVKVSVEHGRVDVSFVTQHPDATAAVQQGLDQLNQMLGGQGLSLGHATVGQHAQQQFGGQAGQQGQASGNASDEVADTPVAAVARVAVGLVDAFA